MRKKVLRSALAAMFLIGLVWAGGCSTRDPATVTAAGKTTSAVSTDSIAVTVAEAVKVELQKAASASATPAPAPASASATPAPAPASTPVPTAAPPLVTMSFTPIIRAVNATTVLVGAQAISPTSFTTMSCAADLGEQTVATASVGGFTGLPLYVRQNTYTSSGTYIVTIACGYTVGTQIAPIAFATGSFTATLPPAPGATPTPAPTPTPASTPVPLNTPGPATANFDGARQSLLLTGLSQSSVWTSASSSLTPAFVYAEIASGSYQLYLVTYASSASLGVALPATGGKTLPAGGNTSFAAAGTGTFVVAAGAPGGLPAGFMNATATSSPAINYNNSSATGSAVVVKANSSLWLLPGPGDQPTIFN